MSLSLFVTMALLGCSQNEAPRASVDKVTEIALADVPQSVQALVVDARSDFQMS